MTRDVCSHRDGHGARAAAAVTVTVTGTVDSPGGPRQPLRLSFKFKMAASAGRPDGGPAVAAARDSGLG